MLSNWRKSSIHANGTVDVSETVTGCWWKKSLARQPRLPDKKPFGFGGKAVLKTHKPKNVPKRFIRLNKFHNCSYTLVYLRQHTFVLVQSNLLVHTKPLWLCLLTFAVFLWLLRKDLKKHKIGGRRRRRRDDKTTKSDIPKANSNSFSTRRTWKINMSN